MGRKGRKEGRKEGGREGEGREEKERRPPESHAEDIFVDHVFGNPSLRCCIT